jgi:cytochrome c biogenesis protein ResB
MSIAVLTALINVTHPSWWLILIIVLVVVLCCVVRCSDRLALAWERIVLTKCRQKAFNAALAATSQEDRAHPLAVLAELNIQTAAIPDTLRQRKREKRSGDTGLRSVSAAAGDR